MSSRRSRSRQSAASSRITDDQVADLLSKLQSLLPAEAHSRRADRGSAARVLQDTCSRIRSLHREVDDLSQRISELLASSDVSSSEAAIIRNLFM